MLPNFVLANWEACVILFFNFRKDGLGVPWRPGERRGPALEMVCSATRDVNSKAAEFLTWIFLW